MGEACYLQTTKPIASGREILISYGRRGNMQLLASFGFYDKSAPITSLYVEWPRSSEQASPDECKDVDRYAYFERSRRTGLTLGPAISCLVAFMRSRSPRADG